MKLHCNALHCIALHYIAFCITLHCIALHSSPFHGITVQYITLLQDLGISMKIHFEGIQQSRVPLHQLGQTGRKDPTFRTVRRQRTVRPLRACDHLMPRSCASTATCCCAAHVRWCKPHTAAQEAARPGARVPRGRHSHHKSCPRLAAPKPRTRLRTQQLHQRPLDKTKLCGAVGTEPTSTSPSRVECDPIPRPTRPPALLVHRLWPTFMKRGNPLRLVGWWCRSCAAVWRHPGGGGVGPQEMRSQMHVGPPKRFPNINPGPFLTHSHRRGQGFASKGPPNIPALTLPQRRSHTPTPAPTAFPTARNRPPPTAFTSPVTALQPLWNFPDCTPPLQAKPWPLGAILWLDRIGGT